MKFNYTLFLSLFFLFQFTLSSQNDIVIGKIDSVTSTILNETRKIMVHVPKEVYSEQYLKRTFPVIYLLDGDSHFKSVVGLLEQLSNTSMPRMMVVAIPNTNRNRDLTPSKAELAPPMVPQDLAEQSGGGKNFMNFLEKELFPYIENNYPTAPYRLLIGHSLGGLFAMDVLQDKPELFNSYIAIDPSMWWDNKKVLNTFKSSNLQDAKYQNKSLYLGIANTLDSGMDTTSVKKVKGPEVAHINSIFETRDLLKNKSSSSIEFNYKYYENESHGSVPLITTYDGLKQIFKFYEFEVKYEDVTTPNSDVVSRMKAHYTEVTQTLGYENKPDESMVNGMGYQLMQMGNLDLAGQFFQMNIDNFPKSYNVYDSYGDYCLATNNKEKAIKSFEQALALKENPASRKKLEELKKE